MPAAQAMLRIQRGIVRRWVGRDKVGLERVRIVAQPILGISQTAAHNLLHCPMVQVNARAEHAAPPLTGHTQAWRPPPPLGSCVTWQGDLRRRAAAHRRRGP